MYDKLPCSIIAVIYEYDGRYKETYNFVIEHIKAHTIFNPTLNNFTVKEWSKTIRLHYSIDIKNIN